MRFAETDESIFLSTVLTALQEKWCKIVDADFVADEMILTTRKLNIKEILTEIAAKSLKDSWSVSKSFILIRLDFLRNISSFFLLILMLQDIMIELIFWLYSW